MLAFNAFAAGDLPIFEKGLRVLELELNKFESCLDEGKTDCDDSEVDNFRLLDEGHLEKDLLNISTGCTEFGVWSRWLFRRLSVRPAR